MTALESNGIIVLGTGNALVTRCYNTCFALQCFDIHSSKEPQFGFTATFANGLSLRCLGDEPYNPLCRQYARSADWLMHEAFCTYADRERFKPYEKSHSTVLDAGRNAHELRARNLILYHTEDRTLETRRERYAAEARTAFPGGILVPDELEVIFLNGRGVMQ